MRMHLLTKKISTNDENFNQPTVHIVDDDEAVRKALTLLMQSEDIPSCQYDSAEKFLEQLEKLNTGCLLLDIRMPGMSGMQLIEELKSHNLTIPVVFITGHGDIAMAVQAMKSGAIDFIEKPFDNEYLIVRVKECLSESLNITSDIQQQREIEEKLSRLTKREKQVMELMVVGKQNKMIARELDISTRTVEIHRAKVMDKLGVHSLSDVVRIAMLSNKFS